MKSIFLSAAALALFASFVDDSFADEQLFTSDEIFDSEHILEIEVELKKEDWDTIRLQSRSFAESLTQESAKSPFTYVKGNVTIDGVLIENVGIRKKGFFGSLDENRPSLKIKFSEYVDQDPIADMDRLTLNNNKQDPSRLNQFLAYRIFNRSGTIASRCNLARVTVNGVYLGVYSNVESVKKPMLEYNFGDGSGTLWEGQISDLFESSVERFQKKSKKASFDSLREIASILEAETLDIERLGEMIDIEAFVRFWATESLLGVWDGYTSNQNNFFMYQNPGNSKYYFLPWGADDLFKTTPPMQTGTPGPSFVYIQAILPNLLYRDPAIQELYHETMSELLTDTWVEDDLIDEVDRMEAMIADHILDDNWLFKDAVKAIRKFIKDRGAMLTKDMADGPAKITSPPRRPPQSVEIGEMTATFKTHWFTATPPNPKNVGVVEMEVVINGEVVEFTEVGAYAEVSRFSTMLPGGSPSPTIVLVGKRKSDDMDIAFGLGLSSEEFLSSVGETIAISGWIIEGNMAMSFSGMKMLGGTVKFGATAMTQGEPVEGELSLKIVEMTQGF